MEPLDTHVVDHWLDQISEHDADDYHSEPLGPNGWGENTEKKDDTSKTKSEFLENSKPFDVHTWSDHPEVNSFVDPIYEKYFQSRKEEIEKRHLKVVLLDLFVSWSEDPSRVIAFSQDHNDYMAGTRYNEIHISRLCIDVVKTLNVVGLIHQAPGFFDRVSGKGRTSRIWPTDRLVEMFKEARFSQFDVGNHEDRLTVILRENDTGNQSSDIEYEPTDETDRMSSMLARYNRLLASTYIDIPELQDPWIEIHKNGKTRRLFVSQRDKFVRRIFNRGSFECGGRFWGGWWQRCPKELRPKIFIDNQSTREIDFSGLHIVMLYADEGIDYWETIGTDPYEIPVPDFLEDEKHAREVAKLLVLMLLNSETSGDAYSAFRKKMQSGTPEKRLKDAQLSQVYKLVQLRHPAIEKYFGSDAGIGLMNRDAQITEIVLDRFLQRSIPVLSLHDSYIAPVSQEAFLVETMSQAFQNVMGVSLAKHQDKAMKGQNKRAPVQEVTNRYSDSWRAFQEWQGNIE